MATELQKRMAVKQLQLKISKAETAKEEIELKILEHEDGIERQRHHATLQDAAIAEARANLENMIGKEEEE